MKMTIVALAFCSLSAFAADTSKPMKVNGYVSEAQCGATHNTATPDEACVKKCIAKGSKAVFVDDDKKKVWAIDNPEILADDAGKPVTILATLDASAMSLHVDKVTKVGKVVAPVQGMKME
jgi:hypothetical protein